MNSHELRIGNYIEVDNAIAEVIAIKNNGNYSIEVKRSDEVIEITPGHTKPIELGIDLLINNCRFDKKGKHKVGIDHHLYFLKFHNGYMVLSNFHNEPVIHFWDVRHLHQLQNLYYALKGKELEIVMNDQTFA